jgi:signal transduction histidine kinase
MRSFERASVVDLMRRRYGRAGVRTSSRGTILLRRADEAHLLLREEAGRAAQEYGRVVKRFARRHGLDVMIAGAAVAAVVEVLLGDDDPHAPRTAPVLAALAALVLVLPLLARRRSPFLAPAWLWLVAAALSFLDGRLVVSSAGVYAAGMVSAFLIGSLRDERQGRIGLAILAGAAAIIALNDPARSLSEVLLVPATFALAWLGGFARRERAEQALRAEERAQHAEREREAAARIAVAEERARIAREVHDIVAHAVSVMVLQAGAVRHRLPDGFSEDVEALRGVEQTGRSALGEMRRLLGAMRRGDDGPELAPPPGLGRLDDLLEETRRAGLPVQLHVDGEPFRLPVAIDLSAYRIVQEGLTNALKHAHANQAHVEIRYAADALRIQVSDDGDGAAGPVGDGLGHGLVGIRERVKLYGGEMTAAANGGGFRLTTSLPLGGYGS